MKMVINITKKLYNNYKKTDHIKRCDIDAWEKAIDKGIILPNDKQEPETVTDFADRCKECGARYGKLLKEKSWIPLSERLPEIQQSVLLTLKNRPFDNIVVGFRATRKPYFYIYCAGPGCIDPEEILAWMPLPEPYKESEENVKKSM